VARFVRRGLSVRRSPAVWLACGLLTLAPLATTLVASRAAAAADPKAKKATAAEGMTQTLNALVEAHHMLAVDLSQLRDQLKEVQSAIADVQADNRQDRDTIVGVLEQIKGMREEVRGLYVESSGLKGDIAQLGKQVEGLDGSLGNFRLSAGIVVAVVIMLQVGLVGLLLRGRG
jgi:regulator of replication initiation timing